MKKAWLKYSGIVVTCMAVFIAVDTIWHYHYDSRGFMIASLLVIVGVSSFRRAKKLNHNHLL